MTARSTPSDRHDATRRLHKARGFLVVAEAALGDENDAAASNAALAAIAASDAICGATLGRRAAGEDHREAGRLLRQVAPVGADAAKALQRALAVKNKAQYQAEPVRHDEALRSVRAARQLLQIAERILSG